uniref:Regulator of G protein signaling 22 n=1 Tax=Crocodylus porosus TaxID=8502 RepID=A0A7M4E5Y6_CROPO
MKGFRIITFQKFLLQTFAQPVKFNPDFGIFEVINDTPLRLESQLKKILHAQKPPNPIYNVTRKAKNDGQFSKKSSASSDPNINPNYRIMCLDREQGIQWIKKERLPAFLESDCYFEYRLAKLISQVEWSSTGINFVIDTAYYPWIVKREPTPPLPEEDEDELIMKKFYATVTQTKDWFALAKQSQHVTPTDSVTCPLVSSQIQVSNVSGRSTNKKEESSVSIAETPSCTQLRVYLDQKWESETEKDSSQETAIFQTLEEFTLAYIQYIVRESVSKLTGQPAAKSKSNVNFSKLSKVFIYEVANKKLSVADTEQLSSQIITPFKELDPSGDEIEWRSEKVSLSSSSETDGTDIRASWCISHRTYDIGNRNEFERFKKFIKGTLGERYWWLWMDIERLKVLKDTRRQQRQLDKMKKIYLVSSGDYFLNSQVLLRLDLLHGDQWNVRHLRGIQPEVVKPLLLYWGPRFCVTHSSEIQSACAKLKLWHMCQERPRMDIDPFPQMVTLLPLRAKSCMPRISAGQHFETHFIVTSCNFIGVSGHVTSLPDVTPLPVSMVLGGFKMESMLQSLYVENKAGYFFTRFCEKSGNKLWKNSTYFWFDLQTYHQHFYQETLHPFKICKQAQFLYATYIAPSASMGIGLQQNKKYEIYQKMEPPFEDLFDSAEEYILTLLLEPWMKMVEVDKCIYEEVELVEETRQLDSVYFRKLQALHQESVSKKDEVREAPTSKNKLIFYQRGQVPDECTGSILRDLLRNKLKLEQFRLFLEENFAMYVFSFCAQNVCCLLWEFCFIRKREEKSKDIKNKYLNKKYFFGPNSPATREQQEQLMQLGGGWGQILHDQVSSPVLLEIQKYVQMRLGKKWLPLFLSNEQAGTYKKTKVMDIAEDLLIQRNEKRNGAWKHVDNKWVSSSREIITFRKALLNPVTAFQFQRFVSLKGDLLGNGVLFWQEVQKYKDMCHSHCDDVTIQNKITAIINCFINSAIPPALQIDIPVEQAQKIVEHRRELGPYVFREAQMTIFALLFKFWPKFCEFRSNLADEKILPVLGRKKEKKVEKGKRKSAEERLTKTQTDFLKWFLQVSWSYSKYIEALEQERVLLKMQEDLERKTSSFFAGY